MEYAKGKISARGREISWLNHPCYLGYKGQVGYKIILVVRYIISFIIQFQILLYVSSLKDWHLS